VPLCGRCSSGRITTGFASLKRIVSTESGKSLIQKLYRDQNAALQTGARDFTNHTIVNTSVPAPLRDVLWSSRFDQQMNQKNSLRVRYSFNRSTDTAEATFLLKEIMAAGKFFAPRRPITR
jgi:hypothetical protein